jgi:hypothetical protein
MLPKICTEELEKCRKNKTGRGVSDREGFVEHEIKRLWAGWRGHLGTIIVLSGTVSTLASMGHARGLSRCGFNEFKRLTVPYLFVMFS